MKRLHTVLLLCASVAVGCTQIQDRRIEARQRRMARAAYTVSPGACNGVTHSVDYAKGFEEGYYDVASGGDGCPPPLPPEKYWRATYNSPLGQEHVKAWFQGFRDGAAAAKADGVAAYGTIYVAEEHRNANRNRGTNPPQPNALNPQPIPPGGMNQVPVIGPQQFPVFPPTPMPNVPNPPMSDAQKAPPLKDVQPPPMPMPPPSAQRQNTMGSNQVAASPIPAVATPATNASKTTIQTSAAVESKPAAPAAEPVQLKLPEFELPAGFNPEAALGEPKALGVRGINQ
jgi:hypothetical protein